ncbi:MAG TPA: SDR family NAD(P)-dependent oxidoreductase [Thermoplasmata archaeon]|nr:SDR family NAD(P)-dependent oxidoreductase [Thermoplasmata archaeon]
MEDPGAIVAPILVTGASGAIGGAVAARLCADRRPVVLWTRDREGGETACRKLLGRFPRSRIELVDGDLGSLRAVGQGAERVASSCPRLGGVIHSAAVLTRRREETSEGLERMFATNHLGPFLLTRELLARLDPSLPFRVLTVAPPSATPLDLDDLLARRRFRSLPAFAATKTANLMFAFALARRFGRGPRTSNVFFPGVVRSGLMREAPIFVRGFVRAVGSSAERAGEALAWLSTGAPLASANGAFFEGTRVGSPPDYVMDAGLQERLWSECERLVIEAVGRGPPPSRSALAPR